MNDEKVGPLMKRNISQAEPISRLFGYDRGKPIDRYYIENFLRQNSSVIKGRVMEVADNAYTTKFGGDAVIISDILNTVPSKSATIVGDLSTGENIPVLAFDCIILTQVINFIYNFKPAVMHAVRALKPGGTLLLTAAGISQISRYDMDRWGDYWRFTDKSLRMVLEECEAPSNIAVATHGNVAVAKAFLDGLALEEMTPEILDYADRDYQMLLTAVVKKGEA